MRRLAFIIHLRTIEDIFIACPFLPKFLFPILRYPLILLFSILGGRLGFSVRAKFKIGKNIKGHILLIWLTGEQMMSFGSVEGAKKARSRTLEAVLYAQNKLKCQVIGLGALTASITDAGRWLTENPAVKAAITHGDSYSTYLAAEGIKQAAKMAELNLGRTNVAIVGATGIIGEGLVYQLAPLVKNGLILIGRNLKRLEEIRTKAIEFGCNPNISLGIDNINEADINEADIIVTATSWYKAIIGPDHLKPGAIVYEVSQPRNVSASILEERSDVLVIDGAYTAVPKNISFWWMGQRPQTTFACMAETIMQTLERDQRNHIGKVDPEFVEEVRRRAEKYGFNHAPFTSFNKPIDQRRLSEVAKTRKAR